MNTKQAIATPLILSILIAGCLAMNGCASMADAGSALSGMGNIKEEVSTFDEARTITVSPAPLYEKGKWSPVPFHMGAGWSESAPDIVFLVLSHSSSVKSGDAYVSFRELKVNIDGEIRTFDADSTALSSGTYNKISRNIYTESRSSIAVPLDYFRQMLEAEDVRIRISSSSGYADATFSESRIPGGQATAKHYMLKFLERIEGQN